MYKFASFFVLISTLVYLSQSACPEIISRPEWGAKIAPIEDLTTYPPTHVIIHHADSASCSTQATCAALVRAFQDYDIDVNKWREIGYNFLIGGDGNIYEGRGWGKKGMHTPGYNYKSIGICAIGSFKTSLPVEAAIAQFHNLIECGVENGEISPTYKLIGHRQVINDTDCPGDSFYNLITNWPHWTDSP